MQVLGFEEVLIKIKFILRVTTNLPDEYSVGANMSHMPHTSMDHTMNTCHCIVQDIAAKQLSCTLNLNFYGIFLGSDVPSFQNKLWMKFRMGFQY